MSRVRQLQSLNLLSDYEARVSQHLNLNLRLYKNEYASIIKLSARYKIVSRGNLNSNVVLPVPHSRLINSNFEADVLETHSHWAFLPMIFVISIFELTKTARSAFKVLGVGSIGLLVSLKNF